MEDYKYNIILIDENNQEIDQFTSPHLYQTGDAIVLSNDEMFIVSSRLFPIGDLFKVYLCGKKERYNR